MYQIPCADCDMTYVGQKGRTLQVHRKKRLRALTNSDSQTSALAEHALAYHRDIAWNEAEVLNSNTRLNQRCVLEAWHIHSRPHPMNRESGDANGKGQVGWRGDCCNVFWILNQSVYRMHVVCSLT